MIGCCRAKGDVGRYKCDATRSNPGGDPRISFGALRVDEAVGVEIVRLLQPLGIEATMRFVPIKSAESQASAMVLKTRDLLVRQRSQTINALRAHLAELGIVAGTGVAKVAGLVAIVRDAEDDRLPAAARLALTSLADQINSLTAEIEGLERQLVAEVRRDADMRRLTTIVFALLTKGGEYRRPDWATGMAPAA